MRCPKCGNEQHNENLNCESCGIIIAKFILAQQHRADKLRQVREDADAFPIPGVENSLFLYGRLFTLLLLCYFSSQFIFSSMQQLPITLTFFHMINLPFHEAGHIFLRPFGDYLSSLGGTLAQLFMPLICLVVLRFQTHDGFGAAVCLWWLGQNFHDIAPYIDDARSLTLPLIGGNFGHSSPYGVHDWEFLLNEIGMLSYDHTIALTARISGTSIMIVALIWCTMLLLKQQEFIRKLREYDYIQHH